MNLLTNMLVEWPQQAASHSRPYVERILWLNASSDETIVIRLFDNRALPVKRSYSEIVRAIKSNDAHILQDDPYLRLLRPENEIKKAYCKRRDEAWELIKGIADNCDLQFMFNPAVRGPLIANLASSSGRAKKIIYDYLRRYWQAGRVKNALLPAFSNCGGKGKRRLAEHTNAPKLGRRNALAKAIGRSTGIRITPDIERRFEKGIRRFYETSEQLTFTDAFALTLKTFFHNGFKLENGVPIPILPPAEELPSVRQFRYWYENIYRNIKRERISRYGESEYNLQGRELLGDSTQMAIGPGSLYEIDATIANVYLISSLDRTRIIGRPVVYSCEDVFSRVITGFSVTLEGPSWLGAMLAIDNVVTDKVAFCAEYGISIKPEEWPCNHLPEAILADRGEFAGYNASNLVNAFGTRMHNTGVGRADLKGIIEQSFGKTQEKVLKFIPGFVPQPKRRGEPDYQLKAALTLDEFRKLLIYYVLDHNMNRYLKSYRKDEFMIADHVERYPLELWKWGIINRSGHLSTRPQDIVRLNLLPRKKASVTLHGIHFEGELYYTCDLAMREGWFGKARLKGSWKIEVAYDIRSTTQIYLPLDGGTRLEVCHLTPASQHLQGRDFQEVRDYFACEHLAAQKAQSHIQQSGARFQANREHIVSEAVNKTRAALIAMGTPSKNARKRGIRSNRVQEQRIERDASAWLLGSADSAKLDESPRAVIKEDHQTEEEYIPPSPKTQLIRKHRDKEWKKNGGRR